MNLPIIATQKKYDGNSSYSVKNYVQNNIIPSKDRDICHVADAPKGEREK